MKTYYVAKVSVETEDPNTGKVKKHTESYLVDALSVTEAESIVVKDFEGHSIDFEVKSVTKSSICKVL